MVFAKRILRQLVMSGLLLSPFVATPLLANTAVKDVELRLGGQDVAQVAETGNTLWLQLAPKAQRQLKDLTAHSSGQRLTVMVEGVSVLSTQVRTTINSGVLRIDSPTTAVRKQLEALRR